MSDFDDLVERLCPSGVPIMPLGELGTFVRGNGIQKSDFTGSGVGCIHYGQIHTHYGTWATETKSFVSEELAARTRKARTGDLVIVTTSEDDEAVGKAVAWLGRDDVAVSTDAFIFRHSLDPRFVAYFFQTNQFQSQKMSHLTGTKVRRISGDGLSKIRMPVPPIDIQREIVRVLDLFESLEAELEAELEARQRQFEHYRGLILARTYSSVLWAPLGEVSQVRIGQAPPADVLDDGEFSFVNAGTGESGRTAVANTEGDTVTIPSRGQGGVGVVGYQREQFWCGPLCYRIRGRVAVLSTRFLFHYLKSIQPSIRDLQQTGGTPALNRKELITVGVAIPDITEQGRIADLLDQFDSLVNDLSIGLPAELAARRKQYGYYRDRLLTFKEAA